jgi:hypothetical protein
MTQPRLDEARRRLGLSTMELWVDFFALGGTLSAHELERYLHDDHDITDTDHNVLVHALNELFHDRGQNHPLAYRSL